MSFPKKVNDYFYSNQEFSLVENEKYDWLETKPVPDNLSEYYKSEDYISHNDSKSSVLDKIYQLVKNYNHSLKYKLLTSTNSNKSILDVGAGTGDFLNYCQKKTGI